MGFTFDDAVHVLGLDLLTDDDLAPQSDWDQDDPLTDYGPHQYTLTIAWDGNPADAKWYATAIAGLARRHVDGCVVTYVDARQ